MIVMPSKDQIAHAGTGLGLAAILIGFGFWISLSVVVVAAIGKEVYDYYHPATHTCEVMDACATILGGLPVWLAWLILMGVR
nr:hypothetical protein [uncultured Holophaga sp.]